MATFEDVFIVRQCDWPVSFPGGSATRPTPWETAAIEEATTLRDSSWNVSFPQNSSRSPVVSGAMTSVSLCGRMHLPMKEQPATWTVSLHTWGQACQTGAQVLRHRPSDRTEFQWAQIFFFLLLKGGYSQWSASSIAQWVKNLPAMQGTQETQVWSLGQEDPLEKEMVTHSNMLAWRIPWTEEHGGLQSLGSQRVRHNWATKPCHHCQWNSHCFSFIH